MLHWWLSLSRWMYPVSIKGGWNKKRVHRKWMPYRYRISLLDALPTLGMRDARYCSWQFRSWRNRYEVVRKDKYAKGKNVNSAVKEYNTSSRRAVRQLVWSIVRMHSHSGVQLSHNTHVSSNSSMACDDSVTRIEATVLYCRITWS